MIGFLMAAAVNSTDVGPLQRTALDTYRSCVSKNAREFRRTDLSGDSPEIVVYAAEYTCSGERADLIEKTKQFLRERHPDLTIGSLGKVTAMFVENQDADLEQQLASEFSHK